MDYNSARPNLKLPEYGRNVQKMVNHCMTIEDRDERNKVAKAIVGVMGQLMPQLRDTSDFAHKLWAHLFIISDFQLDVDSPYPIPTRESVLAKPERLPYPNKHIKYKHYGKAVEDLIAAAIKLESEEEKVALTESIANLMKRSYLNWNRDSVNDEVIFAHLERLSEGQLKCSEGFTLDQTNHILFKGKKKRPQKKGGHGRRKK